MKRERENSIIKTLDYDYLAFGILGKINRVTRYTEVSLKASRDVCCGGDGRTGVQSQALPVHPASHLLNNVGKGAMVCVF